MPRPLSDYPHIARIFSQGAAYSVDAKLLGSQDSALFIDSQNMQSNGIEGDFAALSKIYGEFLEYPSTDTSCTGHYGLLFNTGAWTCMGTLYINYHVVEFWADALGVLDPFIRVDGQIMAASPDLPLDVQFPIQLDKNESCGGGLFCVTDYETTPIVMDLGDIIANSQPLNCTQKYFDEFNIGEYQVNFKLPNHHPVFVELSPGPSYAGSDAVFGTLGMKIGMHVYSFRYFDKDGNRTNKTATTPLIPVPINLDYRDNIYPAIKTFGQDPGRRSGYGVVLRFRVQNDLNYTGIEIIRWSYDTGAPIGFTPSAFVIGTIPISSGEFSVKTIVDYGEPGIPLSDEEDVTELGGIEAAKSCRFFDKRLGLFNIKYRSKDVRNGIVFTTRNGNTVFPVMDKMGKIGHNDPWYGTYRRSARTGEMYGLGVGFWGAVMDRTYVVKEPTTTTLPGWPMPDRRDAATTDSQTFSYNGLPRAATYTNNTPIYPNGDQCFEPYDLEYSSSRANENATSKSPGCNPINLSCDGVKCGASGCGGAGSCGINDVTGCSPLSVDGIGCYDVTDGGYRAMHPTGDNDGDVAEHNYRVNDEQEDVCDTPLVGSALQQGFAPVYYALGIGLNGIDIDNPLFPKDIQAFSVLRTPPAGRVVCQGLGFYYLASGRSPEVLTGGRTAKKDLSSFFFYSSELASRNGLITSNKISEINNNTGGRYQAQLISPTGFFSEVPWGWIRDLTADVIDTCVYARFYKDDEKINPSIAINGGNGYVRFGMWRNTSLPGWETNLNSNKAKFTISGLRQGNNNGTVGSPSSPPGNPGEFVGDRGNEYMVLNVSDPVYLSTGVGLNACDEAYDSLDVRNFQEPVYVINILDTGASINVNDSTQFLDTGTYQKIETEIFRFDSSGTGTGSGSLNLIDERWEDVRPYSPNTYNSLATIDTNVINSLIYIKLSNGTRQAYLNADGIANATINTLEAFLPYTIGTNTPGGSKDGVTIHGFYRTQVVGVVNGYNRFYAIEFPSAFTIKPPASSTVIVRYDKTVPIGVYGFDTWVGDDLFCPVDRKIRNNHQSPNSQASEEIPFYMGFGFPFYRQSINPRILIQNNADGASDKIQSCCNVRTQFIRQMFTMFNCESPIHLPYYHDGDKLDTFQIRKYFPATNYIQRPTRWDTDLAQNKCSNGGNIYDQYYGEYPGEDLLWRYGGYRFWPLFNIDYMHSLNIVDWIQTPVNFQEKLAYCTRFAWSLEHDPGQQDVPGLRTFLPGNIYDIDDRMGEIKKGWTTNESSTGFNIYAFTERGINVIFVGQDVLRDATGDQIAVIKTTQGVYVQADKWLHLDIGLNQEMWRTFAEDNNIAYFTNLKSVYAFNGAQAVDLLRENNYYGRMRPVLNALQPGYQSPMVAYYDTKLCQYVIQLPEVNGESHCFVYKVKRQKWDGFRTFAYDQYLNFDGRTLGMGRFYDKTTPVSGNEARTYTIGEQDYLINDSPIESWAVLPFTPAELASNKEMVGVRIVSDNVPDRLDVYDDLNQFESGLVQTTIPSSQFDNYFKQWEAWINRRISNGDRIQGQNTILVPVHEKRESFILTRISLFYKMLFKS